MEVPFDHSDSQIFREIEAFLAGICMETCKPLNGSPNCTILPLKFKK